MIGGAHIRTVAVARGSGGMPRKIRCLEITSKAIFEAKGTRGSAAHPWSLHGKQDFDSVHKHMKIDLVLVIADSSCVYVASRHHCTEKEAIE